jgi:hypothetical protein
VTEFVFPPHIDPVALADGATIDTDARAGVVFRVTIAGNRTLGVPTNPRDGMTRSWEIKQASGGPHTLALAGGTGGFAGGSSVIVPLTLSTGANTIDVITARYNGTSQKWWVIGFVKGYA